MQLPAEFARRIQMLPGDLLPRFLKAYDEPLRRGVRVNTNKISIERFLSLFAAPLTASPFAADSFYLDAPHKAGSDPLHHAGAYYMQEPSAASAVTVLAPQRGERVLDLCAAPGGKSTQILAALGHTGLLWSNEYVPARAKILTQNIERMGGRRVVVSNCDSGRLCEKLQGCFDAVLVDAPCSGEGMFRKEPQALTEWSVDNIRLCAARQQEILHNAAMAVRPGGRLVYSTCTFAPEENEGVIAAFLAEHPDFSLMPINVAWGSPAFGFDDVRSFMPVDGCDADLSRCRRILPHEGGEGHFIALLQRDGNVVGTASHYTPSAKDAHRDAAAALYAETFLTPPDGVFVTVGDYVRLLPSDMPDISGCGVIAAGFPVAEICKNRLEPCHAAYLAATLEDCRLAADFAVDDPRLTAYLHGEEIAYDGERGFTAVGVAGIPVGFGKASGGRLKNRYPKGLRIL